MLARGCFTAQQQYFPTFTTHWKSFVTVHQLASYRGRDANANDLSSHSTSELSFSLCAVSVPRRRPSGSHPVVMENMCQDVPPHEVFWLVW